MAGCRRVWVVYPEEREVYIHSSAGIASLRADDFLEDAELLPGFSMRVSELLVGSTLSSFHPTE